jgi:hypothetical protein
MALKSGKIKRIFKSIKHASGKQSGRNRDLRPAISKAEEIICCPIKSLSQVPTKGEEKAGTQISL